MCAQLKRSEVAAQNLANMHVTKGPDGEPYRRQQVVFEELLQSRRTALLPKSGQALGELTGEREKTALVRMGLEALIARESARRLAALGGTEPNATRAPRRRVKRCSTSQALQLGHW